MATLGDKIRYARSMKSLTQTELGKLVGSTQANIGRYELNQQSPTVRKLQQIAKATGTRTAWFLEDIEDIED